ncbi:hypothetical protein FHS85_004068 [Rhodoligotrophos appendicifer]|uniref:DUF3726 domain-containing protein n=1 Tax=Rhodoligotrophos appendicifer TaxID=987056 RepID=UPI00118510CA|nr:DUF3726 domain-containing protein [Rhodoligotrophos appendicifer]
MTASAGEMIDLSMNEIEMIAYKAARGAGLSWGIAEDVGRSARWLAARGGDWAPWLLRALEPEIALDRVHSPFFVGAELCDQLDDLAALRTLDPVQIESPIWSTAMLAVNTPDGMAFDLALAAERVAFRGDTVSATTALSQLGALPTAQLKILPQADVRAGPLIGLLASRSSIAVDDHAALDLLVYKTYVPNSEKSRLRGAGARPSL